MYSYSTYGMTDAERKLKRQLDDAEYELQRERDERERDRTEAYESRQREMEERMNAWRRSATGWPDALSKQAYLFGQESDPIDENDNISPWFSQGAAACRRAIEIWGEEEAKVQPQIDELMAQVATLRDTVRFSVADRLEAEGYSRDVAGALREFTEGDCELWLDW